MDDKKYLEILINMFKKSEAYGTTEDIPEGSKYIRISYTLVNEIVDRLEEIKDRI